MELRVCATEAAPVRAEPRDDAEQVTQVVEEELARARTGDPVRFARS